MININISEELKAKCPKIALGCVEAEVKVEAGEEELWRKINSKCSEIQTTLRPEEISKVPNIESSRRAYKAIGKDPSRYRLSSESLLKRIVKGMGLYKVNNVVDINNLISLSSGYSVGTYDLNKIEGDITFVIGGTGETYEGIGRGPINLEKLPIFQDNLGKFGSSTSDSERAMIREETKHILMNIISFEGHEELEKYMSYAIELLREYASGKVIDKKIIK
ncbi:MAG: phenylalanine--tRNA ligase beta subunit-related protein [Clostridium sp.]